MLRSRVWVPARNGRRRRSGVRGVRRGRGVDDRRAGIVVGPPLRHRVLRRIARRRLRLEYEGLGGCVEALTTLQCQCIDLAYHRGHAITVTLTAVAVLVAVTGDRW